ncbi:MAG: GNAT family N-acetyltransferase [Phycisphaerales bacterium]
MSTDDHAEPTLRTARLTLRAPEMRDADAWEAVCGPIEVARGTLRMPHPYPKGGAADWFAHCHQARARGERASFIMVDGNDRVVGMASLDIAPEHRHAELGYTVAMEHWGKGYATEASQAVVDYGFERLGLERIHAGYYLNNPGSGRVLEKLGFVPEGVRPRFYIRFGEWMDLALMRLLREEWETLRASR